MFWSGEKLARELPSLMGDQYNAKNIDCASYSLSVGDQAFVTSENLDDTVPAANLLTMLEVIPPNNILRISPGQFAFILTEEFVKVPKNAIAFISMRAKLKFKGLINVSGFHVDPGWKGKLLFSVYNAGPNVIYLERKQKIFLIVYADLSEDSAKFYDKPARENIESSLFTDLQSQAFSPVILRKRLDLVQDKVDNINIKTTVAAGVASIIAVMVGIALTTIALFPSVVGAVIAQSLKSAGYEVNIAPKEK